MIDPRYIDPALPIYQTPDKIIDGRGRVRRREREIIPAPEQIQRSREEEYIRQVRDIYKTNPELAKEINNSRVIEKFKDDLKNIVANGLLEAATTIIGGGNRRSGRLGKPPVENGGYPTSIEDLPLDIQVTDCEVCLVYTESEYSAGSRYLKSIGERRTYTLEEDERLADILLPRKQWITCYRRNKPECQIPPPKENEEIDLELPEPREEDVPIPPPPQPDYNHKLYCPITVSSRQKITYHTPILISEDPFTIEWRTTIDEGGTSTVEIDKAYVKGGGAYFFKEVYAYEYIAVDVKGNISYLFYWDSANNKFQITGLPNVRETRYHNGIGIGYRDPNTGKTYTEYSEFEQITTFEIGSECSTRPFKTRRTVEQPISSMKCDCKALEKKLDKILKLLGDSSFPIKAPRRLIQPRKQGEVKLKSHAELFEYLVRQLDRSLGHFPFTIEIEDTDLVKEGNQSKVVNIESLSDGVKQALQILTLEDRQTDVTLNMLVRILMEVGVIHKMTAETHYESQEAMEFMGFEAKDKTVQVPFAFNPIPGGLEALAKEGTSGLEKFLPELLKETMVEIKVSENVDNQTLWTKLLEIQTLANTAAAGVSERVGSRSALSNLLDGTQSIMQVASLLQQRQILEAINGLNEEQFKRWVNELELRYTKGQSPVPEDIDEPFQQPATEKPKFKVVKLDKKRLDTVNPSD